MWDYSSLPVLNLICKNIKCVPEKISRLQYNFSSARVEIQVFRIREP